MGFDRDEDFRPDGNEQAAWNQGMRACLEGLPVDANPHGAGGDLADAWEGGWIAQAEALEIP
jgi:hypothetical protein